MNYKFWIGLAFVLVMIFSCRNSGNEKKQLETVDSKISDSKPILKSFSRFDFYISREQAWMHIFKHLDSLTYPEDRLEQDLCWNIVMGGYFAGIEALNITLTFYSDKLCSGVVRFRPSDELYNKLLSSLESKYGKGSIIGKDYDRNILWNLGKEDGGENAQIHLQDFYPYPNYIELSYTASLKGKYKSENYDFFKPKINLDTTQL